MPAILSLLGFRRRGLRNGEGGLNDGIIRRVVRFEYEMPRLILRGNLEPLRSLCSVDLLRCYRR
jgi:hypothetical protein